MIKAQFFRGFHFEQIAHDVVRVLLIFGDLWSSFDGVQSFFVTVQITVFFLCSCSLCSVQVWVETTSARPRAERTHQADAVQLNFNRVCCCGYCCLWFANLDLHLFLVVPHEENKTKGSLSETCCVCVLCNPQCFPLQEKSMLCLLEHQRLSLWDCIFSFAKRS